MVWGNSDPSLEVTCAQRLLLLGREIAGYRWLRLHDSSTRKNRGFITHNFSYRHASLHARRAYCDDDRQLQGDLSSLTTQQ